MNKHLGLMSAMLLGGAAMAADGIKLGGFVDAAYMWEKTTPNTNTFGIADGALYLGKTMGMGEVMVDVAFGPTNAGDNILALSSAKSQAWVSWKYDNGFMWKMGQFDTMFWGLEANDSADRFFSHASHLKGVVPVNHLGLMLGYDFSDAFGLDFAVANPNGGGHMDAGNPDIMVKLNTSSDGFTASVAGLFTSGNGANNMLFDIMASTKVDALDVGVEAVISKPDGADTGFGLSALLTYGMDEMISLGGRFDWSNKIVGAGSNMGLAIGPEFAMNKEFKVRLDYGMEKAEGADAGHAITLSAVHRF